MQIRPACPASTTNMSSTTSIRPRLLFLANFIDFCELGHSSGISLSKLRGCHKYQDRRGPEECQNLRSLNVMRNVRTHVLGYQEGHIFLWCWVPSSSWYFVWKFFVLYWQSMKFGTLCRMEVHVCRNPKSGLLSALSSPGPYPCASRFSSVASCSKIGLKCYATRFVFLIFLTMRYSIFRTGISN